MKKDIFAAGALVLSGCSYFVPQSSQTPQDHCGCTPLTASLGGKARETNEQLHFDTGVGADRCHVQFRVQGPIRLYQAQRQGDNQHCVQAD